MGESIVSGERAPILSNLAKAAEKMQAPDLAVRLLNLSKSCDLTLDAVDREMSPASNTWDSCAAQNQILLTRAYPSIESALETGPDRAVLRVDTWGKKVAAVQKSLLQRYIQKGDDLVRDKELFVCEACGFIFLGDAAPAICPICKAPASRFVKI